MPTDADACAGTTGNGVDAYGGEGAYKEEEQAYREDQERDRKQDEQYAAEEVWGAVHRAKKRVLVLLCDL